MSTIRNPDEFDPLEVQDCEETGHPLHKVGDRVYLSGSGETGIVVRTWLNEALQCQECFVCFDDGGNPSQEPGSCKPYVLKYLCSSLVPIEDGEDAPEPWSLVNDEWADYTDEEWAELPQEEKRRLLGLTPLKEK